MKKMNRILVYLFWIIMVLVIADGVTTAIAIESGNGIEGNPIPAAIFDSVGLYPGLIFLLILQTVMFGFTTHHIITIKKFRGLDTMKKIFIISLCGIIALRIITVINNLKVILS